MQSAAQKPITILFDAGPLVNGNRTGVGKTTEGLIQALADHYPDDIRLVGHYFDFLGRKHVTDLPQAANISYRRTVVLPGKVFNMLRRLGVWVPFELLTKRRGDFLLFPGFIGWPSLFGTPNAPFVHDITYIDYPQYVNGPAQFDLRTIMPRTIRRASFIITNSESSKQGLARVYDLSSKPVLVEPIPPVGLVPVGDEVARGHLAGLGIDGDYVLFFGTIEPRKNLTGLLQAFERLDDSLRQRYALVLAGGKGWKDDEILATIGRLQAGGTRIIQTGYVSDEQRAALYSGADLFVLPSHYEGFGMPLLEAMAYRTPMLVSDIAVHHEVAGPAAAYCQTDPDSIAAQLTRLLGDQPLREKLVVAGTQRLPRFSWDTVARDIYTAIRDSCKR